MAPLGLTSKEKPDLESLVRNIATGDTASVEQLRQQLIPGIRFLMSRSLGGNCNDNIVLDIFRFSIQAIQNHEIQNGKQLLSHVRLSIRSRVAGTSESPTVREMPPDGPICEQRLALLRRAFSSMSERDREILRRFYVLGQDQSRIVAEMHVTPALIRVVKSKAKTQLKGPGASSGSEPVYRNPVLRLA
jgi:hypothetical protein